MSFLTSIASALKGGGNRACLFRADALVWALSELMLGKRGQPRVQVI